MRENKDRISYLHLRDFKEVEGREFPDYGEGLVNFEKFMKEVDNVLESRGWAIIEYETGSEDFGRYEKARKLLKGLGY